MSSCLSVDKNSQLNRMQKLNGASDQSPGIALATPLYIIPGKENEHSQEIQGHVYCGENLNRSPDNQETVRLMNKEDRLIQSTKTSPGGVYSTLIDFNLPSQ